MTASNDCDKASLSQSLAVASLVHLYLPVISNAP
jgi:hypothetical protein